MYKTNNKKRRSKTGKEVRITTGMNDFLMRFIDSKRTFNYICTSRTKKIVTEHGNVFFEDKELRKFKYFYLVNQLKNKILEKTELLNKYRGEYFINPYNVEYFDFNKNLKNYIADQGSVYQMENCIEIDIVKAYYNALKILGFIDDEFYNKCISIPKQDRLRLVGSIATVKTVQEYVLGEKVNEFIQQDSALRDVWWLICLKVSQSMQVLRSVINQIDITCDRKEKSFLFYWVDGIYLKEIPEDQQIKNFETNDIYKAVCEELKETIGFDYKLTRLKKIELLNTGKTLELKVFKNEEENEEDYKLFYIPDYNLKSYFL